MAAQRLVGLAARDLAYLGQKGAGLHGAQVVGQVFLHGCIHVVSGFQHKRLWFHGGLINIRIRLAGGFFDQGQFLAFLDQLQGILCRQQAGIRLGGGGFLDAFQLLLDEFGCLTFCQGLLALLGCEVGGLHRSGLGGQRVLGQPGGLGPATVISLEPQPGPDGPHGVKVGGGHLVG